MQLLNLGAQPVDSTLITGGTTWIWDARSLYFHAGWRQQYPIQTKANDGTMDWNYLEASGKGVYVGDTLVMHNGDTDWWGEGDEKIYVDGEDFPSQFGTGTEDYYGYSRGGSASEFFEAPFLDHPQVEGDKQIGYSAMTRVRSLDAIPFTNHLKFDMEIWHHQATTVAYAATTYWYALDGATSNRVPTPDEAARPLLARLATAVALVLFVQRYWVGANLVFALFNSQTRFLRKAEHKVRPYARQQYAIRFALFCRWVDSPCACTLKGARRKEFNPNGTFVCLVCGCLAGGEGGGRIA